MRAEDNARRYLQKVINIDADIRSLKIEQSRISTYESPQFDREGSRNKTRSNHQEQTNLLSAEYERRIQELIKKSFMLKEKVTREISEMPTPTNRAILRNYYINGLTWEETAECVGYDQKTIIRKHMDALIEFNAILVTKCH